MASSVGSTSPMHEVPGGLADGLGLVAEVLGGELGLGADGGQQETAAEDLLAGRDFHETSRWGGDTRLNEPVKATLPVYRFGTVMG